ncbi:MAG: Crp/Fnr family transcriptional regulator, partial [Candidatus Melainabacteria bacterium]|nr:Crp/Fnr family transcriptional regulator [Candidatus Melainabacteria bacterium]
KENREKCICALTSLSPTFKDLDRDELHQITEISSLKNFLKDEIIFFENQLCEYLCILLEGKVKIYKASESKEFILRTLEPTTIFAEAPVFDEVPYYNASATALEDCEILLVKKEEFKELAMNNPKLVSNLLALFSSRVRTLDKQLELLSLKGVESRLANYLLELKPPNTSDMNQLQLDMPKTMLASSLGTVIETLSRAFNGLKKKGFIEMQEDLVKIVDYDSLEELASK